MSAPVYIGVDLGTQSVRVVAVTREGEVSASASAPLRSMRDGVRHEQDPSQWWESTCLCLRSVMQQVGAGTAVVGIAVDATSGTIVLSDERGKPLSTGLMYDDGRAKLEAAEANEAGRECWRRMSYSMQASWALPKLMWMLREAKVPDGAVLAHQNDVVNAGLAGRRLASDSSHALKTGYDLLRDGWPVEVLDTLGVPLRMLPEVVAPGTRLGEVGGDAARETGLPKGVPIFAGMTDGCAAQIASGATAPGSWNTVIGTTLVLKGVTRELLHDPAGVVYSHRSMDGLWLPGGASSTGALAISRGFAEENLAGLNAAAEQAAPTSLVVYPLVSKGERFPFAAAEAEGFVLGEADSVAERYLGVLQGLAMLERFSIETLESLGAETRGRFTISGGAVKSNALNQIRADVLERELLVPVVTEGAFGMAVLVAATETSMAEATARMVRIAQRITPKRPFAEYVEQYERFLGELKGRGWLNPARRVQA